MEMENMINSVHTMFSAGAKNHTMFSAGAKNIYILDRLVSFSTAEKKHKRQQNKLNRIQILMMNPKQ